jgi:hypothetical protein
MVRGGRERETHTHTSSKEESPCLSSEQPSTMSQSHTTTFRVTIRQPEEWKIRAIAEYKQQQYLKKMSQKQQDSAFMDNDAHKSDDGINKSQRKRMSMRPKSASSAADPTVDMTPEQRKAFIDHSLRELEVYNYNSNVLKARIAGLHSVKLSLLWLLKKASLHERSLIQQHGAVSHPSQA